MAGFNTALTAGIVLCLSVSATMWAKPPMKISTKAPAKPATAKPADTSSSKGVPKDSADPKSKAKAEAMAQYKRILECYKSGTLDEVTNEIRKITRQKHFLPRTAQADLAYIPRTLKAYRPLWWKNMRSSSNVSFKATLWGRTLTANFMPSEMLGGMRPVEIRNGKLMVIVSWRPSMVDNPKPAKGYLAERHKLTKAAIGEAIGWHELGHNYISYFLPLKHVMELYENHERLYYHLQEFYADMTSLYHCSPGGRMALLFTRVDGLERYDESGEHDRAAHAIGALILSNVMAYPDKWPSFHFPPKVPNKEIELNTIFYLYEQIDPNWTINEDKAFRLIVQKFISTYGSKVLRMKGMVTLPNRLSFMLMVSDDRTHQKKRDAWVQKKLESLIKSGRADKTAQVKKRAYGYRIEPY